MLECEINHIDCVYCSGSGKLKLKPIELNEDMFIAEGRHRKTYQHPEEYLKIIKINKNELNGNEREVSCYQKLSMEVKEIIPLFYGEVVTNLGKGLVFEKIVDADTGLASSTLLHIMRNNPDFIQAHKKEILESLWSLTDTFIDAGVLTCGLNIENIIVQRLKDNEIKIFSIDIKEITIKEFIPISKWFHFFKARKIKRRLYKNLTFLLKAINDLPIS